MKYGRRMGRRTFQSRVKSIVMKNTETKMLQVGVENKQLYHDVGGATGPSTNQFPIEFNPWRLVVQGSTSTTRIGDKIMPRMMVCRLWLANKGDRPNITYRIIVARVPKAINGVLTTGTNIDLFKADHVGTNGNTLCGFIDNDKGIRAYYDRMISVEGKPGQRITALDTFNVAETHVFRKFVIKKKNARPILYEAGGQVVNNPIGIWVIPYDSFGTLQTDNIASCALTFRLYYKDL